MPDEITPAEPTEQTAEGTPAAPAADPTVPTPAEPTAPADAEVPDWAKDPAAALREVQKARSEAAAARTASRDAAKTEARTSLLKELGLVKDDEPTADPKALAADLATARTAAQDAARELAIYRNAPAGTDVQALLDSRSFLKAVSGIDPTDTEALVAAIGTATTSTTRFKTAQVAAHSGADLTPGDQALPVFTRAQLRDTTFYRANRDAIQTALRDGRVH